MISRFHSLAAELARTMRLFHPIMNGFLFLALFGSQDGLEITFRVDPHKTQLGCERFALVDLGFDDGQIRLFIRHQGPELPLRHLNIRVSPNLRTVLVESEDL